MVWWLPMHCSWRLLLGGLWSLGARLNVSFLPMVQLLRKSSQQCGWFRNCPLNSAAADLLPIWCHPLFWCILKASQEGCSWSFLKDVAVPKVLSKVWVMLKVPQRCGCSKRIPKGCGCTLHLSYTLKTLYFFIPSNSLFPAKDDAALHLQNLATTAPSRFSKVSLYAPSPTRVNFRWINK